MPSKAERVVARIAALIAAPRGAARISAMLGENGRHFAGLSSADADWVRGHLYAALARTGDPARALPEAREDLRTSYSPIVLGGIGRWLRAAAVPPDWRGDIETARTRIARGDQPAAFAFDARSCCDPPRTVLQELDAAVAHLGGAPDAGLAPDATPLCPRRIAAIRLEDQDRRQVMLAEVLAARPSLIAFFYTRCMNPEKCSLTVTRMAGAARWAARRGAAPAINVLAISYDPGFDTAARLRGYGQDRGFGFGDHARLLRCVRGRRELSAAFATRAGFGPTTVNAHARELFLVTPALRATRLAPDLIADPAALAGLIGG